MDRKRFILLFLFLLTSMLLGYLLYRVFFSSPSTTLPPTTSPSTSGIPNSTAGFPETRTGSRSTPAGDQVLPISQSLEQTAPTQQASQATPTKIVGSSIVGAKVSSDGRMQFYNNDDGKFYRFGADGKLVALSDQVFYSVQKVTWSPTTDESIIQYPDGSKIYYNFANKKQVTLPKFWEDFSFSPQGDKIAVKSLGYSPENRWLIVANPDGTNVNVIEPLGDNAKKVTVNWSPNNQIIAFSNTGVPLGANREQILPIGLHGENFKGLIVEGNDFRPTWSPNGKSLVYSVYNAKNEYKPQLWVDTADGGNNIGTARKPLDVNTWADKCSFTNATTIFCGVPQALTAGAGFAPQTADQTPDQVYRIDVTTGLKTQIPLNEPHVIQSIYPSPDGKTIYFTDKNQPGVFVMPNL